MKNISLIFAALLFGLITIIGCENNKDNPSFTSNENDDLNIRIDSIAADFIKTQKVLGFSIVIYKLDMEIYHKGFGFVDTLKSKQVLLSTTFPIASATKPISAMVAMKMVQEGLFNLEDKIIDHLHDFPKLPFANQIQVKHLLTHTSGLPNDIEYLDSVFLSGNENIALQEYYDSFRGDQLFEPGAKFAYTNLGFSILTELMKKVSGLTYPEIIEKYISEAHSLNSLALQFKNIENGTGTKMFELLDSTYFDSPMNELMPYFEGDGGLGSTASDLAKLMIEFKNGSIVSLEDVSRMTEPTPLSSEIISDYGLGFRLGYLEGHRVYGHTGGHKTRWCVMSYFPDDSLSIAVVVNTDRTSSNALEIFGAVAIECLNLNTKELKDLAIPINNIEEILGDYIRPIDTPERFMQIVQYPNEKNLYRKMSNNQSKGERIYHLGNDQFAPESAPMDRINFTRNKNGQITSFKEYYNGLFIGIREKRNT